MEKGGVMVDWRGRSDDGMERERVIVEWSLCGFRKAGFQKGGVPERQ